MDLYEAVARRRDVRAEFSGEPLDDAVLERGEDAERVERWLAELALARRRASNAEALGAAA